MGLTPIFFWIAIGIIGYHYLLFPCLLLAVARVRNKKSTPPAAVQPSVSLIIPAHNEAGVLTNKINNSRHLHYPKTQLEIIVVNDGSTDNTAAILAQWPAITCITLNERKGKANAINRAAEMAKGEILLFTDANCALNAAAIDSITQPFSDPSVGGVCGEKRIINGNENNLPEEGWYWRYESLLKQWENQTGTVMGGTGELLAIRKAIFKPIPEHIILDDLAISAQVWFSGKDLRYTADAYATELASPDLASEWQRKWRISAGCFQFLQYYQPLRHLSGRQWWQFVSRRWMRWIAAPLAVLALIILMPWCIAEGGIYAAAAYCQLALYLLAAIGSVAVLFGGKNTVFRLPFYGVMMHVSPFIGAWLYATGKASVRWRKLSR